MYLGNIVEPGKMEEILQHPKHPHPRALRSADLVSDPRLKREQADCPEPRCRFYNHCPLAAKIC
jgi:peptide/nickel transport system ATP-binding protein